jgi:hypothetical protein
MHTSESIYELVVKDEDRDVWKIYLARSKWELARKYAKVSPIVNSSHLPLRFVHRLRVKEMSF